MLSWLPWLLLWSLLIEFLIQNGSKCSFLFFLVQLLFKTSPNPLLAALPPPGFVSFSILIQNWSKPSPGYLASSCCRSLLNSYPKLIQILSLLPCLLLWSLLIGFLFDTDPNPLLAALASPVLASSSILNRKWCRIPLWLPWLILRSFLIQFLIESDTKSSSGCRGFSCGRFLLHSSLKTL